MVSLNYLIFNLLLIMPAVVVQQAFAQSAVSQPFIIHAIFPSGLSVQKQHGSLPQG